MFLEPRSSRSYYFHDDTILSVTLHYEREHEPRITDKKRAQEIAVEEPVAWCRLGRTLLGRPVDFEPVFTSGNHLGVENPAFQFLYRQHFVAELEDELEACPTFYGLSIGHAACSSQSVHHLPERTEFFGVWTRREHDVKLIGIGRGNLLGRGLLRDWSRLGGGWTESVALSRRRSLDVRAAFLRARRLIRVEYLWRYRGSLVQPLTHVSGGPQRWFAGTE